MHALLCLIIQILTKLLQKRSRRKLRYVLHTVCSGISTEMRYFRYNKHAICGIGKFAVLNGLPKARRGYFVER